MLCPFHVHRATVMLLDQHRPAGQLENILVIKDEALPLGRARIDDPGAPAAAFGIDHLQRLAAPGLFDDGAGAVRLEQRFEDHRSEEHTSELQSLMRISYAVFCLKKQTKKKNNTHDSNLTNQC